MDWEVGFVPEDLMHMTSGEAKYLVNPKIVLQVRVGKGIVGAGMPVLVENISLKGVIRIRIKLFDDFPFIKSASIMFIKKPKIDYVLKPIGGQKLGVDVAHIPGFSNFIRDQIHAILSPMMYSPNQFVVDVEEILKALPQSLNI